MTWLIEDRSRLEAFRRGDRDMLSQVYLRYAADLAKALRHGFTFRSEGRSMRFTGLSSPYDLDEVVQEVFVRALGDKARAAYAGLQPYRAYLKAIARNLVIDRLRHQRSELVFEDASDTNDVDDIKEGDMPSPVAGPEDQAADQQLRRIYAAFLLGLTELERRVVELRFEQELPRRAVCEETGLSPMQLRIRENKIRAALQARLSACGYGPAVHALSLLLLAASAAAEFPWG